MIHYFVEIIENSKVRLQKQSNKEYTKNIRKNRFLM